MNGNMWGGAVANNRPAETNNSMVVFVNDDSQAVNYPTFPGTTVALINYNDPDKGRLYLKSAEANGCPNPMRVFEIKEVTPQRPNENFVSRQEFDNVNRQLEEMKALLMSFNQQKAGGNKS